MAFESTTVSAVTHQEELMVSRAIDNDISKYLSDELDKIGREYCLLLSWPCKHDMGILINQFSGLFIYTNYCKVYVMFLESYYTTQQYSTKQHYSLIEV
ncbi:hypothetical protein P691DRAFT_374937 [Macrolepiota fuliginosa MF-IS2]|uniref:Uncharacterized protein n=1 Tax=Macrolepiota fuliginosa MF-IS2 TaxID=1400762 RepID=A0A9P5X3W3_9AGAR|nr:hypothetical protein P691DRAFT_374937 [Macrolepiota fuliginosa MF-IS2]